MKWWRSPTLTRAAPCISRWHIARSANGETVDALRFHRIGAFGQAPGGESRARRIRGERLRFGAPLGRCAARGRRDLGVVDYRTREILRLLDYLSTLAQGNGVGIGRGSAGHARRQHLDGDEHQ